MPLLKRSLVSKLALLVLVFAAVTACKSQKKSRPSYSAVPCNTQIETGIAGHVVEEKGNMMPSPDRPMPKPKGIERHMFLFPLQNMNTLQATADGGFFAIPQQPAFMKFMSAKGDGCFKALVPPGKYTLLVQENEMMYANSFDGEGNIFPVEVVEGKVTEVEFVINHAAAY